MAGRNGSIGVLLCVAFFAAACGSVEETSGRSSGERNTPASTNGEAWGSYPADRSLDERGAVEAYVQALDARDGARFCAVVAPWISGRFDIWGTDPEARLIKPMRCPELVSNFIGYIEDSGPPEFVGASIERFGELERKGDLVAVPITVTLRLEERDRPTTETLEDVVWVTQDDGAWRVAKLSAVAAAASLTFDPEGDPLAPPDLDAVRSAFAAEVAAAERRWSERSEAYREVQPTAECHGGSRYEDARGDVVDYLHPAPRTPTPQLPAADIRAVHVQAAEGRICIVFELGGTPRGRSTFSLIVDSPDFDWGRSGVANKFEVELRGDGRARVTNGRDDQGHSISVPGAVGIDADRLMVILDEASFAEGMALPGSKAPSRPLEEFRFQAAVTYFLSKKRYLHDDVPDVASDRLSHR